jgi:hypothetical protein
MPAGSQDLGFLRGKGVSSKMWVTIGVIALAALVLYLTFGRALGRQWGSLRLEASGRGVRAEAVVVEARKAGAIINEEHEIEFTIEVRPSVGAPYRARVFKTVPPTALYNCEPGRVLKVLYDPKDPRVVAILGF